MRSFLDKIIRRASLCFWAFLFLSEKPSFLDILAVIKSVAYLSFDRLLAHCRTSFCHIHRPKAASRDWQELADTGQSMSDSLETIFEASFNMLN